MWPFKKNQRLEQYLADPALEPAVKNWGFGKKSLAKYLLRFDEDQARRIISAYTYQDAPSRHDPIEDDPQFAGVFNEVGKQIEEEFPQKRRGQCHSIWRRKKALLKTRGIDWLSPSEINPYHRFD